MTIKRDFGGKRKNKKSPDEPTEEEHPAEEAAETPAAEEIKFEWEPTPTPTVDFSAAGNAAPMEDISKDLFKPFSVGDIKQVQSAPDHKPPKAEDTIPGRYAAVLFTSASTEEALFTVYEDIIYLQALYKNSETFKLFT